MIRWWCGDSHRVLGSLCRRWDGLCQMFLWILIFSRKRQGRMNSYPRLKLAPQKSKTSNDPTNINLIRPTFNKSNLKIGYKTLHLSTNLISILIPLHKLRNTLSYLNSITSQLHITHITDTHPSPPCLACAQTFAPA